MSEKTIVKEVSVSGSEENKLNTQSDEGKSPSEKELENRIRENLRAEYERKTATYEEKLEAAQERIAELDEKVRLTEKEKAEKLRLERKEDELERLISSMDNDPDPNVRAWNEKAKRESSKAANEAKEAAKFEVFLDLQKEFLEEKAEELGIDYKKFTKELSVYQGKYADKNPLQRAKLCLRDWNKDKDFAKRESELKRREDELKGFGENGSREIRSEELSKKNIKDASDSDERLAIIASKF